MNKTTINQVKKEMKELGVSKRFTRCGDRYISEEYSGEYGRTYLVLYQEEQEYEGRTVKEQEEMICKCAKVFIDFFKDRSFFYCEEEHYARLQLGNRLFLIHFNADCDEMSLELNTGGNISKYTDFRLLIDEIFALAHENPIQSIDCTSINKEIKDFNTPKDVEYLWRCDIMIPDDDWGNTCTTQYGKTFTGALERATSCRAALGW